MSVGAHTGAAQRIWFYWEDNGYAASPTDSTAKVFGYDTLLDTADIDNDATRVRLPGTGTTQIIKEGTFDGAWAVTFAYSTPWWLRALYGPPTNTDNGDGSFDYDYSGFDPDPLQINVGYEESSDVRTLQGCVATNCEFVPTVDENTIGVTLEGFYATEPDSVSSLVSQPSPDDEPLDYADANLQLNASDKAIVQEASLSIGLDATEPIVGFGSRFPTEFVGGSNPTPVLDVTEIDDDTDSLDRVYGGAASMQEEVADDDSLTLDIDNGKAAGSGINKVVASCSGGFPNTFSEANTGDPTETIEEQLSTELADVSWTATNETSTAP